MIPSLAVAAIVVALVAVVWKLVSGGRGDARFSVKITGPGIAGVAIRGDVPGYASDDFAEFIAALELPKGAEIWGIPDRGRLALRFRDVPEGPQQRVRNLVLAKYR